jgi:hypothetical protein
MGQARSCSVWRWLGGHDGAVRSIAQRISNCLRGKTRQLFEDNQKSRYADPPWPIPLFRRAEIVIIQMTFVDAEEKGHEKIDRRKSLVTL